MGDRAAGAAEVQSTVAADRARGALVLLACGDALGAPFAGMTRIAPGALDTALASAQPLRWSECTATALVVAEHVTRRGGVDPDMLGRQVAAGRSRMPGGRPDAGAAGWATMPPEGANVGTLGGGGAAVSTAPLGLVPGWKLPATAGQARRAVAVTHHDPPVADAAAVIAAAVAVVARWSAPAAPEVFLERLAAHTLGGEVEQTLRLLPALVSSQAGPGRVAAALGDDRSAMLPVLVGVVAFLRHQRSPWLAVRFAIGAGGDTLPAAAVAGVLCGAYLGEQQVPPQWAARLAGQARLRMFAGALASLGRTTKDGLPPAEVGHRTGTVASAIRGSGNRADCGSGGKGYR